MYSISIFYFTFYLFGGGVRSCVRTLLPTGLGVVTRLLVLRWRVGAAAAAFAMAQGGARGWHE